MKSKIRKLYPLLFALTVLLLILAGAILTGVWKASATETKFRIGILISGQSRSDKVTGLEDGLAALGFIANKNVIYHIISAAEDREKLTEAAHRLIADDIDVIITPGGVETLAAMEAITHSSAKKGTAKIPSLIFAGVASPDALGIRDFNKNLRFTGVENQDAELSGKRLEYLQNIFKNMQRVGLVYQPGINASERGRSIAKQTAEHLHIATYDLPVNTQIDIENMRFQTQPGDALLLMPSFFIEAQLPLIYRLSLEARLPVMGLRVKDADKFCTLSFGPPAYQQGIQAARLAALVLQGHNPLDLPVETPDSVELVLNLAIAEKMGLSITPDGLLYPDRIVRRNPDE